MALSEVLVSGLGVKSSGLGFERVRERECERVRERECERESGRGRERAGERARGLHGGLHLAVGRRQLQLLRLHLVSGS